MKGFISKALVTGTLVAGLVGGTGCYYHDYWDLVDPCYPEHYNCDARGEVAVHRLTQATNGLVLEQTVWNYHFKEGSDQLLPAGQMVLDRMARRRPMPVADVFLQTAHDVAFSQDRPDQMVLSRADLDAKRIKAVTDYLAAARPDVAFTVQVHDPSRTLLNGEEARKALQAQMQGAAGSIKGGTAGTTGQDQTGGGQVGAFGTNAQGQQPTGTPPAAAPGAGAAGGGPMGP